MKLPHASGMPRWVTLIGSAVEILAAVQAIKGDLSTWLLIVAAGFAVLLVLVLVARYRVPSTVTDVSGTSLGSIYAFGRRQRTAAHIGLVAFGIATLGYFAWRRLPPRQNLVLIADFDSDASLRQTQFLIEALRDLAASHPEIRVKTLGQVITEQEGSEEARRIGRAQRAALVIWGWTALGRASVRTTVHFESLSLAPLPESGKDVLWEPASGLDSLSVQVEVSKYAQYLALVTLAASRIVGDDYKGGAAALGEAATKAPRNDKTMIAGLYHQQSDWLHFAGDYKGALHAIDSSMRYAPSAMGYNNRSVILTKSGLFRAAVAQADSSLALERSWEAYVSRGNANSQLDSFQRARADFDSALSLGAPPGDVLYGRAVALFKLGDYLGAVRDCDTLIHQYPPEPAFYVLRGNAYVAMDQAGAGIASADSALALDPTFAEAYFVRALGESELPDWASVEKDLRAVLRLSSDTILNNATRELLKRFGMDD